MSPDMASMTSSTVPQLGSRVDEKSVARPWCGETPAARASVRRRGPAGTVVEVVEGIDEVPVRSGRQVGPRQCTHHVSVVV